MKAAGSPDLNGARWGLGRLNRREPCGGPPTAAHSIKLINGILNIMRVGLPGGRPSAVLFTETGFCCCCRTKPNTRSLLPDFEFH